MTALRVWLAAHWVAAALLMGLILLAVLPVGIGDHGWPITLVYLTLPAYMLHQVEEHWGDRFRIFINTRVFGGLEALTVGDVLWINLPGVWGINLLALYAARFYAPGYGLTAIYLMLVNAIVHIANLPHTRSYNPGLVTAVILFLPLSIAGLILIPASIGQHIIGLAIAVAIHIAIIVRVKLRLASLRR